MPSVPAPQNSWTRTPPVVWIILVLIVSLAYVTMLNRSQNSSVKLIIIRASDLVDSTTTLSEVVKDASHLASLQGQPPPHPLPVLPARTSVPALGQPDDGGGGQTVRTKRPLAPAPPARSASVCQSSIGDDADDFVSLADSMKNRQGRSCTDKHTGHRYQELYALALHHYRRNAVAANLLEIGLGCGQHCVAGGAMLYRRYLPAAKYHVLEYRMSVCGPAFLNSNVDADTVAYIHTHLCEGSQADADVLNGCGARFGPFDIFIDDGSHVQEHVITTFNHMFRSPYVKPGGVYVVEDIQTSFVREYSSWPSRNPSGGHAVTEGTTMVNALQQLLLCKLARATCGLWPGKNIDDVAQLAQEIPLMVAAPESLAFWKRESSAPDEDDKFPCQTTSDVFSALAMPRKVTFDEPLKLWVPKGNLTVEARLHLRDRFPTTDVDQLVQLTGCDDRGGTSSPPHECLRRSSNEGRIHLAWIELRDNSSTGWNDEEGEERVVELVTALMASSALVSRGVVVVSGLRPSPNAEEWHAKHHASVTRPLLRFVLDLTTALAAGDHTNFGWPLRYVDRVRSIATKVSCVSVDDRGLLIFRKSDPRHR